MCHILAQPAIRSYGEVYANIPETVLIRRPFHTTNTGPQQPPRPFRRAILLQERRFFYKVGGLGREVLDREVRGPRSVNHHRPHQANARSFKDVIANLPIGHGALVRGRTSASRATYPCIHSVAWCPRLLAHDAQHILAYSAVHAVGVP